MAKTTLVILAAGIGSRYGGIKQLDAITKNGDTIIDFSIYDAIKAGFTKIVFVVNDQIHKEFKADFDEKLKNEIIELEYVNQGIDALSKEFLSTKRTKPWGTGHALLMAKDVVNENFCVINADDFYGKSAFEEIYKHLQKIDSSSNDFSMVGYQLENTLSENGSVSRGQCFIDEKDNLEQITERTQIYQKDENIVYLGDDNSEVEISPNEFVSMNIWGFTPNIFDFLEKGFYQFLRVNSKDENAEFFLPKIVNDLIEEENAMVKVLKSKDKWMGVTYREDKAFVKKRIEVLQDEGFYSKKLW